MSVTIVVAKDEAPRRRLGRDIAVAVGELRFSYRRRSAWASGAGEREQPREDTASHRQTSRAAPSRVGAFGDLEARRKNIPDAENSVFVVQKAADLLP